MKFITILILFIALFCYNSKTQQVHGKQNASVLETKSLDFREEVKEVRSRTLNLKEMKVVQESDTLELERILSNERCDRLYLDFAQNSQELLLQYLDVNQHTELRELLQSYPTVFEDQVKDLSGNLFGGAFVVPIYSGRKKLASIFSIRNNRVSSVEVILPAQ